MKNMLEILKDPEHEEYEDTMEWLGEDFDPEYFDPEDVSFWAGKVENWWIYSELPQKRKFNLFLTKEVWKRLQNFSLLKRAA